MMKKYNSYKDSGAEWLGDIPEHWELILVKRFSKTLAGGTPSTDKLEYWGGDIPWLPSGKLQNCDIEKAEKFISKLGLKKSATKLIRPNTTLIALTGATCANIGYLKFKATANQSVVAIENDESISSSRYVFYALINERQRILLNQTGGAQAGINENDVKNIEIVFPPLPEQTAIAQFLDDKTTKIDQAIAIKQQQIALLKERKQILIHKAVTRGLDDSVPLKDSGVEWIGEIPEHWEVKRLRYMFELGKGLTITKENLQEDGVYCINYGEIHSKYGFEVDTEIHPLKCVVEDYIDSHSNALINKGDFVFADTSEDIEGSGNFTYLKSNNKIFAGYHTVIARPIGEINSRFFAYVFESESFRNQIRIEVKGVKVYSITQSILKRPFVWFPFIKEQNEIVDLLDFETQKIDTAIELKQQEIEKLKEYKGSLINSVVTGKVKVS